MLNDEQLHIAGWSFQRHVIINHGPSAFQQHFQANVKKNITLSITDP